MVRDKRAAEGAAVAGLEDRRLDFDEAARVERAAQRAHDSRAGDEVGTGLLVHQQVDVAAPVALLDVGEAVKGVGERRADPRQHLEAVDEQRRLAAARPGRVAGDADDVAEVDVDLTGSVGGAEQLDPAGTVDEIEKGELAVVAAGEDAPGEASRLGALAPRFEALGLEPDGGDLVSVGEALGGSGHAQRLDGRLAEHHPGPRPLFGCSPLAHDLEATGA